MDKLKSLLAKIPKRAWYIGLALIVLALLLWAAYLRYVKGYDWAPWTELGEHVSPIVEPGREYYPSKNLWDILDLLIIPVILVIVAVLFDQSERKTDREIAGKAREKDREIAEKAREKDREIATDRLQEANLQAYLDRMAELLLEKDLLQHSNNTDEPVRNVAQTRTTTILRNLDQNRRDIVFQFLRDAGLAESLLIHAHLEKIDLSGTNIVGVTLSRADLHEADLSQANLRKVNLHETNLSQANLSKADLNGANLSGAVLIGANLRRAIINDATQLDAKWHMVWQIVNRGAAGADLSGQDLNGADLNGADLNGADLNGADLNGANLFKASLGKASLGKASLSGSELIGADLSGADLSGAVLIDADLNNANLSSANLHWAILSGSHLDRADLSGANLLGAVVTDEQLAQASFLPPIRHHARRPDLRPRHPQHPPCPLNTRTPNPFPLIHPPPPVHLPRPNDPRVALRILRRLQRIPVKPLCPHRAHLILVRAGMRQRRILPFQRRQRFPRLPLHVFQDDRNVTVQYRQR